MSPPYLEILSPAGQSLTQALKVYNAGEKAIIVDLYVGDFWYDSSNKRAFPDPGTTPYSAASWISFPKRQVEIPARGSADATFVFAVPLSSAVPRSLAALPPAPPEMKGAAEGPPPDETAPLVPNAPLSAYATVFVEKVNEDANKGQSNLGISMRIAIPVLYQRSEKEVSRLNLTNFEVQQPTPFKPLILKFSLQNMDEIYAFPSGEILVTRSKDKETVARGSIKAEKVVLPGQTVDYEIPITFEPASGTSYDGLMTLFFGKEKSIVRNFSFNSR